MYARSVSIVVIAGGDGAARWTSSQLTNPDGTLSAERDPTRRGGGILRAQRLDPLRWRR